MNVHIRKMYLIHDWLYSKKSIAEKYNDGKDSPKEQLIIVTDEGDAIAEELPAEDYLLYSDVNELISDLRDIIIDDLEGHKRE
ncbi:hypothetical protein ACFVIX_06215 [Bacillus subtilis]|uniref:hypothetical protein n=1 Tax=Bacillus subtilis group TaxID=653685 RepID=UPI00080C8142|nr:MULTISPECIES: hypothetical protein [Bacillus subtilis group]AVB12176.1 hypothetical protein C3438_22230 [Bacillus velezensis]MCB4339395.1 hypothetical protein [Bacillus subtilis]MCT6515399.1 hypothetical protein [Bacillus subtilis]MDQ4711659.1 hypothetical protein [Bacillus subtilis]MEC0398588.1 hypothetical protein [Bacillus subtilis]